MFTADLCGDGNDFVKVGDGIPTDRHVFPVLQFIVCLATNCRLSGVVEREEVDRGERVGTQGEKVDAFGTGDSSSCDGRMVVSGVVLVLSEV